MTFGYFEQYLQQAVADEGRHMLVMTAGADDRHVVCIGYYEVDAERRISFLWYLGNTGEGIRSRVVMAQRDVPYNIR